MKFALRFGSSKQGNTFRASTDCNCEAARYLKTTIIMVIHDINVNYYIFHSISIYMYTKVKYIHNADSNNNVNGLQ